jgi:uncharacterized protein YbaR (Trm112 family)
VSSPPISPELLEILVCPVPECRGPLQQTSQGLCCPRCRLIYSMEEGWPNLIPEEARPMVEDEMTRPQSPPEDAE